MNENNLEVGVFTGELLIRAGLVYSRWSQFIGIYQIHASRELFCDRIAFNIYLFMTNSTLHSI
jgi:hypothetical protein